ncbi:serpin B4-like isoform X2 [Ursus maritimus]|uniref:Serpin B4-like isoform X2 n=1 Tax=Ursus maritimus TaxID=29073 RepID=A0A8M1FY49_URSMA|nr:serpin B4-like isoform X2 [Ursus arctos]XP_040488296.1 serpin B4-like isoform X2 [Ursus maritimus]
MNSLSAANTRFAFDLFQQFKTSKKDDNIFYSPLSISSALAMTYLGAKENTALEMEKVLHFNEATENTKERTTTDHVENLGNVHHQFQKLLTELKKPTDAYELNIANKLYGEKNFQFLQEYMDNIKKFYLTTVESVDFNNAAEETRKKINSWVESQTHEKIKNLFPKDSLTSTILVLVNAVYFKGQWDTKFDKKNTVEKEFWLNKGMQAKILEIPYKGKDLSMILLLPDEVDGLQKLEDQLTAEKLIEWTSSQNMSDNFVDLYLPRFKLEETYDLKDTLRALGMVDVFNAQTANLSGMTGNENLLVSKVIHKSFVEVTEEGTTAASSTAVDFQMKSSPAYPFHCDHPFLFFIKHNKTNSILFLGRVSSP